MEHSYVMKGSCFFVREGKLNIIKIKKYGKHSR